jgi:hypothetical protein
MGKEWRKRGQIKKEKGKGETDWIDGFLDCCGGARSTKMAISRLRVF